MSHLGRTATRGKPVRWGAVQKVRLRTSVGGLAVNGNVDGGGRCRQLLGGTPVSLATIRPGQGVLVRVQEGPVSVVSQLVRQMTATGAPLCRLAPSTTRATGPGAVGLWAPSSSESATGPTGRSRSPRSDRSRNFAHTLVWRRPRWLETSPPGGQVQVVGMPCCSRLAAFFRSAVVAASLQVHWANMT